MAIAVGERGYAATTVADVVRIARASRRTFYHHFEDRAECFLALGSELTEYALELVATASGPPQPDWRRRIDMALDAYLQTCAATPGLTRSYLLELFGMGDRGLAHRRMAMRRWAAQLRELVEDCRRDHPQLNPMSPQTATAIVGGIWELSLLAAEEGRARQRQRDPRRRLAADRRRPDRAAPGWPVTSAPRERPLRCSPWAARRCR